MRQEPKGERHKKPRLQKKSRAEESRGDETRAAQTETKKGQSRLCCTSGPKDAAGWTGQGDPGRLGGHLLAGVSPPPAPRSTQQVLLPSSR